MSVTFEEILYKKCEEKGIKVVSKYINDVMLLDVSIDTTEHDNNIIDEFTKKIKECCSIVGSCDFDDLDMISKQLKEKNK